MNIILLCLVLMPMTTICSVAKKPLRHTGKAADDVVLYSNHQRAKYDRGKYIFTQEVKNGTVVTKLQDRLPNKRWRKGEMKPVWNPGRNIMASWIDPKTGERLTQTSDNVTDKGSKPVMLAELDERLALQHRVPTINHYGLEENPAPSQKIIFHTDSRLTDECSIAQREESLVLPHSFKLTRVYRSQRGMPITAGTKPQVSTFAYDPQNKTWQPSTHVLNQAKWLSCMDQAAKTVPDKIASEPEHAKTYLLQVLASSHRASFNVISQKKIKLFSIENFRIKTDE